MQEVACPGGRRKSPTREEDEEPEWAVKIGNAPPPQWAHPIPDPDSPNKRPRFGFVFAIHPEIDLSSLLYVSSEPPEAEEGPAPDLSGRNDAAHQAIDANALVLASIHLIDQNLLEIAKEFRFTPAEVKEYYDKCGEMGQTRARFQEMRQLLQEKFPLLT
jgi:hypothetical protein